MKKLFSTLLVLGGIFASVGVEAYCTQDGNYCGGSTLACTQYCTGSHYEEPFCPRECPGYQRYNTYNNYYYSPTPYYYADITPSYYHYNGHYYPRSQYQNQTDGYYCLVYDEGDQDYYHSPDYYNYQSYCDCAGRSNCSCGYYENPNKNNWIPAQRCIQWARR